MPSPRDQPSTGHFQRRLGRQAVVALWTLRYTIGGNKVLHNLVKLFVRETKLGHTNGQVRAARLATSNNRLGKCCVIIPDGWARLQFLWLVLAHCVLGHDASGQSNGVGSDASVGRR